MSVRLKSEMLETVSAMFRQHPNFANNPYYGKRLYITMDTYSCARADLAFLVEAIGGHRVFSPGRADYVLVPDDVMKARAATLGMYDDSEIVTESMFAAAVGTLFNTARFYFN